MARETIRTFWFLLTGMALPKFVSESELYTNPVVPNGKLTTEVHLESKSFPTGHSGTSLLLWQGPFLMYGTSSSYSVKELTRSLYLCLCCSSWYYSHLPHKQQLFIQNTSSEHLQPEWCKSSSFHKRPNHWWACRKVRCRWKWNVC